jgi:V8-like Glu-specific endopeptidase
MKLRPFVLFNIFVTTLFSLSALAAQMNFVTQPQRFVDKEYNWIGKLNINGRPECTTWILKHGIAVTAKHCFLHKDLNEFFANEYVSFFSIEFTDKDEQVINVPLTSIKFDEGNNDIVYLIYEEKATNDKIKFNHTFSTDNTNPNTEVNLAGYTENSSDRIISTNCFTTGFQKDFPATKMDPGYLGVFENTNCRSWYGVSGGPVFSEDPATKSTIIYGVVTHTFDTLESGEPNPLLITVDEFGESLSTMFSSFHTSLDLQNMLVSIN